MAGNPHASGLGMDRVTVRNMQNAPLTVYNTVDLDVALTNVTFENNGVQVQLRLDTAQSFVWRDVSVCVLFVIGCAVSLICGH